MSELRTNLLSNAAGTGPATLHKQSAAKAWANLDGTGTIALRDSQNVSSVVDGGVGDYVFNFASNMSSANYASTVGSVRDSVTAFAIRAVSGIHGTGSFRIGVRNVNTNVDVDENMVSGVIHGDLA